MKLLLAAETYHPNINGVSVFTRRIARGLAYRGHEVHVVAPSLEFTSLTEDDDGVTVHRIRSLPTLLDSRYRFSLFADWEVGQIVADLSPDVVHIQDHFFIGGAAAKAAMNHAIPLLGTNHFVPEGLLHYLPLPAEGQKFAKRVAWRACVDLYNRLNLVTSPSKAAVSLLREKGLRTPALAVSNGVDVERFCPANDGAGIRRQLGLPAKPIVLYTGRLEAEKRMDVLMNAIPDVLRRLDAHFVVCGSGTEKSKLESLVTGLRVVDNVSFVPFLDEEEFPNIYAAATLFAIAGAVELQSIVTLEAMASGLPVVAARALALPELVQDGRNGYLFDQGDVQDMADKLVAVLADPRSAGEMGKRSRKIAEGHSIQKTLSRYEAIYLSLSRGEFALSPSCYVRR
ncbi:MAG: glycosyltransferase [Chloroflexi bacterium]|nr:glycosyltransferase [Chloroflexota bacterium]